MTVCLTGDVHHMAMGTRDQEYLDGTEVEAAVEYAEIAAEHGVPVTLFCTGRAAVEEPDGVRELASMDHVEIGGHNYWAFDTPLHAASRTLLGTWNGPRWFQSWEIRKTVETFGELDVEIRSWRDHAYRHDSNTARLLSEQGITHFSDAVGPRQTPRREDGLTVVPVNTPPDHEHVYHSFRTREFVAANDFRGPFGSESMDVDRWRDWVVDRIQTVVADGTPATVLAHPACMKLADDFATIEALFRDVASRDCRLLRDVGPKASEPS